MLQNLRRFLFGAPPPAPMLSAAARRAAENTLSRALYRAQCTAEEARSPLPPWQRHKAAASAAERYAQAAEAARALSAHYAAAAHIILNGGHVPATQPRRHTATPQYNPTRKP